MSRPVSHDPHTLGLSDYLMDFIVIINDPIIGKDASFVQVLKHRVDAPVGNSEHEDAQVNEGTLLSRLYKLHFQIVPGHIGSREDVILYPHKGQETQIIG